jgi:hypothetical protein
MTKKQGEALQRFYPRRKPLNSRPNKPSPPKMAMGKIGGKFEAVRFRSNKSGTGVSVGTWLAADKISPRLGKGV